MPTSLPDPHSLQVLVDENLADAAIAIALGAVGYNATAVRERFGAGTDDPTLIQWLGLQTGIWITRDKKAKSKHAAEIENSQIHIAWVRFPKKQGLSMKNQLLLILWCIDDILEQMGRSRQPARFLLYYNGKRPKLDRL